MEAGSNGSATGFLSFQYNPVPQGFFSTLIPFLHSKMKFKQQKIVISCGFMSPDSSEEGKNVEQLDNAVDKQFKHDPSYTMT
jgi:hypothetical protein